MTVSAVAEAAPEMQSEKIEESTPKVKALKAINEPIPPPIFVSVVESTKPTKPVVNMLDHRRSAVTDSDAPQVASPEEDESLYHLDSTAALD